ncbi:precorrin-4 C(11)-methyltransferase [Natranaerobius thermophilus]|uniref:Precorrin-4 C11-methyltransferase n=1 Tax=Natranaerobius thermophilus (strain ATCC BAA-1301 / DSM 18059 / JW/NM-WN-LF) TaxID=457570 RepID=B2A0F7_NATTJ|nr:precorrin-4 C(11)-methyltransferase [Natranaerobius thermophilus]ACB84518.1 precorrin-4 C11-methyltransferase [Natranaerobius thermophilus JW/NM-WN-LF]
MDRSQQPKVYFLGAGPGDPELLTRKGEKLLTDCDAVVYAGSLINPALLKLVSSNCQLYDSAELSKEEITDILINHSRKGDKIVRLHSGDPGLYGAIQEQIDELKGWGIEVEIIPGISAYQGAMAALKREFTLPGVTQTVILTRHGKRTPVPEKEQLKNLAKNESTMCIYLSTHLITEVVRELTEGGLSGTTPVRVVYKATWPDEQVISGTLNNISQKVADAEISKTALIVVGHVLSSSDYQESKLYDKHFSHGFRKGKEE